MQVEDSKSMEIRPQIDIKNDANETLVCSKIVVPVSMRSHYWKYFGFPSDDFNNILTKKKIICTLCQTAICYNKNTSNLRTHLVAKHSDIYIQLNEAKNSGTVNKKQKLSVSIITNHESDCSKTQNECDNNDDKQESEIVKPSDMNFIEVDNTDEFGAANEDYDDFHNTLEIEEMDHRQIEIINDSQQVQLTQSIKNIDLVNLISEMLIKDLLSLKLISGNGFKGLIQQLHNSFNDVSISEVESNIQEAYSNKFKLVEEYVKKNSNEAPYCLGLEIFNNFQQKRFLNIYFIHIINDNGYDFKHISYKTIILTNQTNYSKLFYEEKINLSNCAAFIINESNELITSFANEQGIPVMISLDILIAKIANGVFQMESIQIVLDKLTNYFISNEDSAMVPDIDNRYSWSKYSFLKYISDPMFKTKFLLKSDYKLLEQTNEIIDLLKPLRLILDTIADETPYSSLIKPLSEQLLNQNYIIKENDTELAIKIKNLIKQEITEKIINNEFFIETSFLDPRFQHFLNLKQINLTKTIIADKLKGLIHDEKQIKTEIEKTAGSRKSSLKLFFNQSMDKKISQRPSSKSAIEIELDKYSNEVPVDLEYCPITWWDNNDYLYKNLKKHSMKYFSVPCNINNLFKLNIDEEIMLLNKRFLLDEKSIKTLWFLHTNYDNNF